MRMDETEFTRLIDQPFYEVTLECDFDDETGDVTLKEARL